MFKDISVICEVTISFTPYPLFQWYPQSKVRRFCEIWVWRNSAFNAQGSRVIIVVVQVEEVKIYVAARTGGAPREKNERQEETQFTTKIGGKTSLGPSYYCLL